MIPIFGVRFLTNTGFIPAYLRLGSAYFFFCFSTFFTFHAPSQRHFPLEEPTSPPITDESFRNSPISVQPRRRCAQSGDERGLPTSDPREPPAGVSPAPRRRPVKRRPPAPPPLTPPSVPAAAPERRDGPGRRPIAAALPTLPCPTRPLFKQVHGRFQGANRPCPQRSKYKHCIYKNI